MEAFPQSLSHSELVAGVAELSRRVDELQAELAAHASLLHSLGAPPMRAAVEAAAAPPAEPAAIP